MSYVTNLNYNPDKYHYSYVRDIGSTGIIILTIDDLSLPDRSAFIEIDVPPDYGSLQLNGVTVLDAYNNAVPTQISRADILGGLLSWNSGTSDTSLRLNFDYYSFDASGETQSMLYNWLPWNIQLAPTETIDCGDFDTGLSDGGVSSDAGDFISGVDSTLLQSYDGGDFDTGLATYPEAPSLTTYETALDGTLQVIDPDTLDLVDVSKLPSSHETFPRDADVYRYDFVTNYTFEEKVQFKLKLFRGWDYGSLIPNFGSSFDGGSIEEADDKTVDFNEIVNYIYPYPSNHTG